MLQLVWNFDMKVIDLMHKGVCVCMIFSEWRGTSICFCTSLGMKGDLLLSVLILLKYVYSIFLLCRWVDCWIWLFTVCTATRKFSFVNLWGNLTNVSMFAWLCYCCWVVHTKRGCFSRCHVFFFFSLGIFAPISNTGYMIWVCYHWTVMYCVDCCSVLPVMLVTLWTSWDS